MIVAWQIVLISTPRDLIHAEGSDSQMPYRLSWCRIERTRACPQKQGPVSHKSETQTASSIRKHFFCSNAAVKQGLRVLCSGALQAGLDAFLQDQPVHGDALEPESMSVSFWALSRQPQIFCLRPFQPKLLLAASRICPLRLEAQALVKVQRRLVA